MRAIDSKPASVAKVKETPEVLDAERAVSVSILNTDTCGFTPSWTESTRMPHPGLPLRAIRKQRPPPTTKGRWRGTLEKACLTWP